MSEFYLKIKLRNIKKLVIYNFLRSALDKQALKNNY